MARAAAVRGVAVRGEARWRVGSGAGGSSTRPRSGRAPVLVLCDAEEASALVGAAAVTLAVAVAAEKAMAMRAAARAVARAAAHSGVSSRPERRLKKHAARAEHYPLGNEGPALAFQFIRAHGLFL